MRGELGHVDDLAAADARDRLVGVGPQPLAQRDRRVDAAVLDAEDLGRLHVEFGHHAVALTRADRDRDPAFGDDPAVRQQHAKIRDRAAPHVHDERRGEYAGQLHGASFRSSRPTSVTP